MVSKIGKDYRDNDLVSSLVTSSDVTSLQEKKSLYYSNNKLFNNTFGIYHFWISIQVHVFEECYQHIPFLWNYFPLRLHMMT